MSKRNKYPYYAAHHAVRVVKGRASEHLCAAGGDHAAEDWALRPDPLGVLHVAPNEGQVGWFSEAVDDYFPLCRLHHREMDAALRRQSEALYEESTLGFEGFEGEVEELSDWAMEILDQVEPW